MDRRKRLKIAAAILVVAWLATAWVVVIRPIHGRIVDASTGRPIAGAVIVAGWLRKTLSLESPTFGGAYRVTETVTQADGTYELPGWFGIDAHGPLTARDAESSPQLLVFARGYEPRMQSNRKFAHVLMVRGSEWDGKDIELAAEYRNEKGEWANSRGDGRSGWFWYFEHAVEQLVRPRSCSWDKVARMLTALWRYAAETGIPGLEKTSVMLRIRDCKQEHFFEQDAPARKR